MIRLARHFWTGLSVMATVGAVFACADDVRLGELPETQPPMPDAGTTPDADAASELEAAADAGPCSASNVCITPVPIDDTVHLTSVWGSSANDVWAVGSDSTILHSSGAGWEKAARVVPDAEGSFTLQAVWLEHPDDVWIADGHRIRHGSGWRGPTATEWSFADGYGEPLSAIRGFATGIWLAGGAPMSFRPGLLKLDGWTDAGTTGAEVVGPGTAAFTALTMPRTDEVWTIGLCDLRRNCVFRGSRPAVDSGAPGAPWTFQEYDSRSLRRLFGVWGDEDTIWLVGEGGTVRRLTTSDRPLKRFETVESHVIDDLRAVHGFAADDIWAVGDASTVLHWDGTSWIRLSTPFDGSPHKPRLDSVWGSSPHDVWIVGEGTILHFDGKSE